MYTAIDILGLAEAFHVPTFNTTWWYMSLAVSILLLIPLFYKAHKAIGLGFLFLVLIVLRMLGMEFTVIRWYLPTMCVGILFAEKDLFVRIKKWGMKDDVSGGLKLILKIEKILCSLLFLCGLALIRVKLGRYLDVVDALMAVIIIYLCFEVFSGMGKLANGIVGFVGKYSMNMFLAHTFFKTYYFKEFTYSFGNAWLILLMLVLTTLAFSICVELLKEYLGYKRLVSHVNKRIQNCCVEDSGER